MLLADTLRQMSEREQALQIGAPEDAIGFQVVFLELGHRFDRREAEFLDDDRRRGYRTHDRTAHDMRYALVPQPSPGLVRLALSQRRQPWIIVVAANALSMANDK